MAETPAEADLWFRRFRAGAPSRCTLVCFPHAGGAATFFHPLSVLLGPDVEVVAVQYPGRQERRREAPAQDIGTLADSVSGLLPALGDGPFAFFGHSMGAIVAYETALRLQEHDPDRSPVALFCSGRRAPNTFRDEHAHLLSDDGLVDHVTELGGPSAEVLRDEEMRGMLLPAIRADYRALETYRARAGARVGTPVSVLIGDRDPLVTAEEAEAWRRHTTGPAEVRVFPGGGHFYLTREFATVAGHIRHRLSGVKPVRAGSGAARLP